MPRKKTSIGTDKRDWSPSPLVGQIVLVTTVNADKEPNVAPKSWVSMMSFEPPILALGCNINHRTARNILENGEFVINTIDRAQAALCWKIAGSGERMELLKKHGMNFVPASKVSPPRINECKGHVECTLHARIPIEGSDGGIILLGRIKDVSVDDSALKMKGFSRYSYLDPVVYLEEKSFGAVSEFGDA